MTQTPKPPTPGSHRWVLLAIVAIGLAIRVFFASYGLHHGRFEDERFSLRNIRTVAYLGTLEPASTYYPYPFFNVPPAALVAASDALFEATGIEVLRTRFEEGRSAPATYLLCRLVQCLFGALALWLVYLLARDLASSTAGLWAAAIVAFVPWHIVASGYFKPDAQLTAMVVLALLWSIRALQRGSYRAYAWAGLAIALAMSSKLTGGLASIPLVVGVALMLATWWRQPDRPAEGWQRPVIGLCLAGGVSSLAFVLLNPYWRSYPAWIASLGRDYAGRARANEMTHLQIPGRALDFLRDEFTLGSVLGWLAIVALALGAVGVLRKSFPGVRDRISTVVFLAFPVIYTAGYAIKTAYFKPNNFLPVLPFAAIALAILLTTGWRALAERMPHVWRRPLGVAAVVVVLLLVVPRGSLFAYNNVIPTTMDAAKGFLEKEVRSTSGRVVIAEQIEFGEPRWYGYKRFAKGSAAILEVESVAALGERRLNRSDGEIFRRSSLQGEDQEILQGRIDRLREDRVRIFEPNPFELRGPALVVVKHPHVKRSVGDQLALRLCADTPRCRTVPMPPGLEEGALVSVRLWVSLERLAQAGAAWVDHGGESWPMHLSARRQGGAEFVSERFEISAPSGRVRLRWSTDQGEAEGVSAVLDRW